MPLVNTALALQAAPGGDVIIDKLQRIQRGEQGVTLTMEQEKKLEKAQEKAGTTGISEERVGEMLDAAAQKFENRLWESNKAKDAMDVLHDWAGKEYPGYSDIHKSPDWNAKLGTVLDAIQKGTLPVPDKWSDPYQFAVDQTYGWLKGLDPNIGKETPTKKTEKERREAISQSSVQAGGVAPEDSDGLPDWANPAVAARGVAGGGRSFSSLKRS